MTKTKRSGKTGVDFVDKVFWLHGKVLKHLGRPVGCMQEDGTLLYANGRRVKAEIYGQLVLTDGYTIVQFFSDHDDAVRPDELLEFKIPNQITQSMFVNLDLPNVKDTITRWNSAVDLHLDNYPNLETKARAVWGCFHSAVIAHHITDALTEINLVAVKAIHPKYDSATEQWDILMGLFKCADLLISAQPKQDILWQDWDYVEDLRWVNDNPPLPTENDFKLKKRAFFRAAIKEGRFSYFGKTTLSRKELTQLVNREWNEYKKHWEAMQPRCAYLDGLWNRATLEEATARYLHKRSNATNAETVEQNSTPNEEKYEFVPPPVDFGKRIYSGYNRAMAKQVADGVRKAQQDIESDKSYETKMTISLIAKKVPIGPTTCGRYLKVFRSYGLENICGIAIPTA